MLGSCLVLKICWWLQQLRESLSTSLLSSFHLFCLFSLKTLPTVCATQSEGGLWLFLSESSCEFEGV